MKDSETTRTTEAGWRAYDDVGQLIAELDLTGEDMARARETTDEHVVARTQVLAEHNERSRPDAGDAGSWPRVS